MNDPLNQAIKQLKLGWMLDNYEHELAESARKSRTSHDLLLRLCGGEIEARRARAIDRKVRAAKLPAVRTIEDFDWTWPKHINKEKVRHLFTFDFMRHCQNVIIVGTVGLGKTHIAVALASQACQNGCNVLFTPAVDIINTLAEAQADGNLRKAIKRYIRPQILIIDELGYLPVDRVGAELLFQVLGSRYEKASTVITTNRKYADWSKTFANDATLTSAVLDRVLHHSETIVITGESYRMKDRIDND